MNSSTQHPTKQSIIPLRKHDIVESDFGFIIVSHHKSYQSIMIFLAILSRMNEELSMQYSILISESRISMESTFPMVENQRKHGNINSLSMNVLQHKQTSTKLVANTSSGEEISTVLIWR